MSNYHTYEGKLFKIVDGDTVDMVIHLGLGLFKLTRLRLAHVAAPEIWGVDKTSREYAEGMKAKEKVFLWFKAATSPMVVNIYGQGVHGRWIAEIRAENLPDTLNKHLSAAGFGSKMKMNLRKVNLFSLFPDFK